jgi:penicillin-binding protein 1A
MTSPNDLKERRASHSDRGLVLISGGPANEAAGHGDIVESDQAGTGGTTDRPLDTRTAANQTWEAARLFAGQTAKLVRTLSANAWRRATDTASRVASGRGSLPRVAGHTELTREAAPARRRSSKLSRLVAVWCAASALILAALIYLVATISVDGGLRADVTPSALTIQSERGETFATRGVFKGERLSSADLSPHLTKAIVAIEDRRFFEHIGLDLRGTIRAAWRNTQAGVTREGGSTITQQLARLLFLSPERSVKRKIQEALLALWLESQLTKEEILLRYLNTAFFGAGAYGADAAAKRYFGKRAKDMSLAEAAMLAGLVRAPSQLAPTRNFGGARERAETVLHAMVESGASAPRKPRPHAHSRSICGRPRRRRLGRAIS